MIPKILHLNWFGDIEMNKLHHKCIKLIVEKLPGWTVKIHRDASVVESKNFHLALKNGWYELASDFHRIWCLYNEGGVYIDFDVHVRKEFPIRSKCFIGFQRDDQIEDSLNTAVMGCEKGYWFISELMRVSENFIPTGPTPALGCTFPTEIMRARGMDKLNKSQTIDGVKIYPLDYFHARSWIKKRADFSTHRTVCVHHFGTKWKLK